jgi:hypothetical protein
MIDFAKNYYFAIQNEVQSMHMHSFQILILVDITYHLNPNFDLDDANSFLIIEYHVYINDDHKHDSYFMQYCLQKHWIYVVEEGYAPSIRFVWSNSYVGRFKLQKPWYFVGCYPNLINGCAMIWSFFGIGHGKGADDGARDVIKQFLWQEQLNVHGVPL